MGSGASSGAALLFDHQYQRERQQLRQELMKQFERNPQHQDILAKIKALKALIVIHPHINVTAKIEMEQDIDTTPTGIQSAFMELDRLFTIYETSTILKSGQCRLGPVACPLGHHAAYFDNFNILNDSIASNGNSSSNAQKRIQCNICDKVATNGYHCSYCFYSLCVPCSVIYCCNGHRMKLWTHPEAQHECVVCHDFPITSGYRCVACEPYDICDYCTWKDGRKTVQKVILDRAAKDIQYIDDHQSESETAMKTITEHKRHITKLYPTTLLLYQFEQDLHRIKEICRQEVILTRITKAIIALRAKLVYGKEYSKTAYEISLQTENYTAEEQARLQGLSDWTDQLQSFAVRTQHTIACPLAHAMFPFEGLPQQYAKRREEEELRAAQESISRKLMPFGFNVKKKKYNVDPYTVVCRVCDRVAASGYHCDFCEYDLCHLCSVIYCGEGHRMIMWTEPYGQEQCFLCNSNPLTTGYRCRTCHVDMCDICTTKSGRNKIRNNWDAEMATLIEFLQANKRLSDVAMFYQWRHNNQIVAIGNLVEYVKELREAKKRTERQVIQKPIIDKIKLLRAEVIKYADLCATAAREANRTENFVFTNKKKATEEMMRLTDILKIMIYAQAAERRSAAGIACPLGHAMGTIRSAKAEAEEGMIECLDESDAMMMAITGGESTKESGSNQPTKAIQDGSATETKTADSNAVAVKEAVPYPPPLPDPIDSLDGIRTVAIKEAKQELLTNVANTMNSVIAEFPLFYKKPSRLCRICATPVTDEGHTCTICEYDLCKDCSTVYCRMGHPLRIWTLPEAESMCCDVCKKNPITAGYRCLICNIDVCDLCTVKDTRNAFLLWPRREYHRLLSEVEKLAHEAPIAKEYMDNHKKENDKSYLDTMSKLCKKLQDIQEVKKLADQEVVERIKTLKVRRYGNNARDMI